MLSYPIDEAEELLTTRLATAKQNLSNCEEDLDFLREQITVSSEGGVLRFFFTGSWILIIFRRWKLLRHECIIGMLQWEGRRSQNKKHWNLERKDLLMVETPNFRPTRNFQNAYQKNNIWGRKSSRCCVNMEAGFKTPFFKLVPAFLPSDDFLLPLLREPIR